MAINEDKNLVRNYGSQSEPVSNGTGKSDAALREEAVLEFWRENKIFEKSLEKKSPKGNYVFYDGPPFATGLMHYGHILGSTAKDVVGRFQTMRGYHVPRKWGWDCHGLPIENIVEKELNIAGHKEIEKFGIDKFVEYARSKVLQYDKDWEKNVERIGRWVDFKGGYKTMDNTFIESVWWAFSELNKKGLVYEGVRVLAYCARCETPIANSEIAMDNSYRDIPDISIYVKLELENEPGTYLLAWTTTPWTLPGNTAIAINKNIEYVKVQMGNDILILAKETLPNVLKGKEYAALGKVAVKDLIGKKYKPVFPYYQNVDLTNKENIWKVWHADFVTTEKGTGIAHEAPAFGEDDMNLAKAHKIPWIIHVDETGRFKPEVADFAGLKVKPKDTSEDKDAHLRSDIEVIKYLQKTGAYFEKEKIIHSYPHCMRCDTPIIYYALPSWFINIQKVKKQIIKKAEAMNWVPEHLKEGRFKNIVENAPDWNVSRNRFWASPLPVWKCEKCGEKVFISSLAELEEKSKNGLPLNAKKELDLHRPYIDNIKILCKCKSEMKRVPEVLDCWLESGSMPFAQDHYPFENLKWKKNNFPAGFVAEYIAQTRTWFYYSHVVSTILFNHAPFENVVTTGTLLAEDGQKISKSKKNYPDPWLFIDKYGVDALRIYLMTSPLMKGEDANFSEKSVQEIASKIIGRLYNVVSFYELYKEGLTLRPPLIKGRGGEGSVLDQWILARLNQFINEVTKGMEAYDMNEASRPIDNFVEDLSVWYLRRSRERIKNGDKEAKRTLYFVLKNLAKVMAPFAPFTAEDIWRKLKTDNDAESVHLESWPKAGKIHSGILENMRIVRNVVSLGLEARQKAKIQVRQPLNKLEVKSFDLGKEYIALIKDELNVKEVKQNKNLATEVSLDAEINPELKQEGDYRELARALQDMRKAKGLTPSDVISITFETDETGKKLVQKFEADMKKTVLVSKINFGPNDGSPTFAQGFGEAKEIKIGELAFKIKIEK